MHHQHDRRRVVFNHQNFDFSHHKTRTAPRGGNYVRILAYPVNLHFRYVFQVSNEKLTVAIGSQLAVILKTEREKRDLSLKALAAKSGISRQTISYVEQEVQSPSLDTLLRITLAMEVDLAKIIARAHKRALKAATLVKVESKK